MEQIRVGIVGPLNSPVTNNAIGGSETWTYNFCNYLSTRGEVSPMAFLPQGSNVDCPFVEVDSSCKITSSGGEFKSKAINCINNISQAVEIFQQKDNFDLVHISTFDFQYALPVLKNIGKPVIVTLHGMNFDPVEMGKIFEKYPDFTYVYISDAQKNFYPVPRHGSVIRHGINIADFEYSETSNNYYFWMGRISPEKGAHEAIKFAQSLNAELIMAGPIHNKDYYESQVKPYLNNKIKHIGEIGPEEKNKLYGEAKAFLFTANRDEPFGLVVIEANACGTPVLAFETGAMAEIIKSGVNGFLSTRGDVAALVANAAQISRINRNECRQYTEKYFSINRMGDEYIKLYQKLAHK